MAKNPGIIVDTDITDIIIKIFRGDKEKREVLQPIQDELALSVITAMELMNGAKSRKKEFEVSKAIKAYFLLPLTNSIGAKAFALIKRFHINYSISIADALIAATAIDNNLPRYTDNLSDYSFITELQLFKPNNNNPYK
ncbi:MAG: type toxin-antitoxin system VapC family toxin [Segetibacter sp.]|nr:type toxin-antitoxin system VapC family toxin [Segetibacter sp.]